ncbi:MAG: hypothetical protein ACRDTN_07265 [Mycobacterium sp.]
MWCPSATLSAWANAWLAGLAAPDDVLDALSRWSPMQSVAAHDAVAAGNTGLPWPDVHDAGAASLLQTLRAAAGVRAVSGDTTRSSGPINLVLPVPGDVRGLPAGTQFEREALTAGEAVVVAEPDGSAAVGLVPDFADDDPDIGDAGVLSWTVYALPGMPIVEHRDLGDAEYALRSAVRSAADTLGAIGLGCADAGVADPRLLVQQLLDSSRQHRIPGHAPSRAVRVLENAAHVDAIITVSSRLTVTAGQSSSEAQRAADALRPLAAVVRSARTAAVEAILRSAWRG